MRRVERHDAELPLGQHAVLAVALGTHLQGALDVGALDVGTPPRPLRRLGVEGPHELGRGRELAHVLGREHG